MRKKVGKEKIEEIRKKERKGKKKGRNEERERSKEEEKRRKKGKTRTGRRLMILYLLKSDFKWILYEIKLDQIEKKRKIDYLVLLDSN